MFDLIEYANRTEAVIVNKGEYYPAKGRHRNYP